MKKYPPFITNLTPEELQDFYMDLKNHCIDCKEIHKACRVNRNCSSCEYHIFLNAFKDFKFE